jgi:hypothetical protein
MRYLLFALCFVSIMACKKETPSTPSTLSQSQVSNYDTIRMTITQSNSDSIQNFNVDLATFQHNPPGAVVVKSDLFEWGLGGGDTNAFTGTEYIIYQNASGDSISVTGTCAVGSINPIMKVTVNSVLRATINMPLVHPYGWCHQSTYAMKL